METITKKASIEKIAAIHDFDSFGRAVVQQILEWCSPKYKHRDSKSEEMDFDMSFSVTTIAGGHIVCTKDPDGFPGCCVLVKLRL
jgi:hypothetical protein